MTGEKNSYWNLATTAFSVASSFRKLEREYRATERDLFAIRDLVQDFLDKNKELEIDGQSVFLGLPLLWVQQQTLPSSSSMTWISQEQVMNPESELVKVLGEFSNVAKDAYKKDATTSFENRGGTILCKQELSTRENPAFWMYEEGKTINLVVRGTKEMGDVITDANAKEVPWPGKSDYGLVHSGILGAASNIVKLVRPKLLNSYSENKKKKINIVGHSLGGGTAVYIKTFLEEEGYDVTCYSYGAPPTFEKEVAMKMKNVYSVVNRDDVVPRLSYTSLMDLQIRALKASGKGSHLSSTSINRARHFVPGHFLLKVGDNIEEVPRNDRRREPEIILSSKMVSDHKDYRFGTSDSAAELSDKD